MKASIFYLKVSTLLIIVLSLPLFVRPPDLWHTEFFRIKRLNESLQKYRVNCLNKEWDYQSLVCYLLEHNAEDCAFFVSPDGVSVRRNTLLKWIVFDWKTSEYSPDLPTAAAPITGGGSHSKSNLRLVVYGSGIATWKNDTELKALTKGARTVGGEVR